MHSIVVDLKIHADEFQRLYQGSANNVTAYSRDGRRVRFPASILRPFVTRLGIEGSFAIHFSVDNRFQGIEKID